MDQAQDIGNKYGAAFQVVILGGGGGPGESDTTGILLRSTSTRWTKNSIIAIDAGVHLSAMEDIVRQHLPNAVRVAPPARSTSRFDHLPPVPALSSDTSLKGAPKAKSSLQFFSPVTEARGSRATSPNSTSREQKKNYVLTSGPFADLMVPYENPSAIAAYMLRNLVSTIVVTHPHLDHLSGFAINTAALGGSRKKIIAGLPKTVEAIKTHIFNDVIWPNMSDEDGGIGFISYNRLVEGGHPALGDDDASGYSEICDGLEIKGRTVSHGHCMKQHRHRGSGSLEPTSPTIERRRSLRMGSYSGQSGNPHGASQLNLSSEMQHFHAPTTASPYRCVIDSSAFFIRDEETGKEVLIFGDVEPDEISEEPRNFMVWADAAPKIARDSLEAIFIECSYDDSQPDGMLFGHLAPRWVVHELAQLASKVNAYRSGLCLEQLQTFVTAATPKSALGTHMTVPESEASYSSGRKRRRTNNGSQSTGDDPFDASPPRTKSKLPHLTLKANKARPSTRRAGSAISPMSSPSVPDGYFGRDGQASLTRMNQVDNVEKESPDVQSSIEGDAEGHDAPEQSEEIDASPRLPLQGLKIVIIHVKDPMKDDHDAREVILRQCKEHEAKAKLGCEFYTCRRGDSIWV